MNGPGRPGGTPTNALLAYNVASPFDLDRSAEAASRLLTAGSSAVRILRPVVESALHPSFVNSTTTTDRRRA
jgi:hypothetical protein